MSIQVRRRREAAAFLATYAGAGGELIVDTTDNRVQVHDGATAGGWPAARVADLPGRNTLLNGNFAINQRAYGSGATLAANAYAHDRWKAGSGGCAYTYTQAATDTTINITAGSLIQIVDAPYVFAPTLMLSWVGTAKARVYQGGASASSQTNPAYAGTAITVDGVASNYLLATGLAINTAVYVEFSTGTLGLAQLEAPPTNAGPTRFERRMNELALCQRYFWATNTAANTGAGVGSTMGCAWLNYAIALSVKFPSTMRAVPTVALFNGGVSGQVRNSSTGGTYALNANNFGSVTAGGVPFMANSANTGLTVNGYYDFDLTATAEL